MLSTSSLLRSRWHQLPALVPALSLAGLLAASMAQAQPTPPMPPAPPGASHPQHDPDRMRARWEEHRLKRQAELKAKLQLTPAQEPAWAAFIDAIKPPGREAFAGASPSREEFERLTTPERIDKMRALRDQIRSNRQAMLVRREEATKAFYASLSAEQKKTFDAETYKLFQRPVREDGDLRSPPPPAGRAG